MAKLDAGTGTPEEAADPARLGLETALGQAGTSARPSPEGAAELGRLFAELLHAQSSRNLGAMMALGRAKGWPEFVQLQHEFLRETLESMSEFASRYLAPTQGTARAGGEAGDRAAAPGQAARRR